MVAFVMAGVPIVMGWQLTFTKVNSTLAFSGPLFATLLVSYSWHRSNPASLCWWEQTGYLWGLYGEASFVKLCLGIDLQRVHRVALLL